jgi:hypothetical protein
MKPDSWHLLPSELFESFVYDNDALDFASKIECIHDFRCDNISDKHRDILDAYWKSLNPDRFHGILEYKLARAECLVRELKSLM